MVHESSKTNGKSKIAVIGVLFKIGRADPVLTKVTSFCLMMTYWTMIMSVIKIFNLFFLIIILLEMVSVVKTHKIHGG